MKNINIERSLKEILQNLYSIKKKDLIFIKKKNLNYNLNKKKIIIFLRNLTRFEVIKYFIFKKNEIRIVYKNKNSLYCKRLFPNLNYQVKHKAVLKKYFEHFTFFLNPNFKIISLIFLKKKNGF